MLSAQSRVLSSSLTASNINWLPCGPSAGLRNLALYLPPTIGLINPPGSYVVVTPGTPWNYLESDLWPLIGGTMPVGNFDTTAMSSSPAMDNSPVSGAWCFLELTAFSPVPLVRPSQATMWGSTTSGALRVTCEWYRVLQPFADVPLDASRGANLQSFLVIK